MTDYTPTDYAEGLIAHHGAEEARAIAEAIMEATRTPTTEEKAAALVRFTNAARVAHECNYAERGDRYAEPNEMEMHRADPCACWEMVADDVEAALGATYERAVRGYIGMFDAIDLKRAQDRADPKIVAAIRAAIFA